MKFSSLAIAALIGAMNINDVAALQKKHHHHQPHHHAKMQTFEEPAVKATVEADPQFQEDKDKLKKMKKEKTVKPELTEDEEAANFKKDVADLSEKAAAKKAAKDVKHYEKVVKEDPLPSYKEKLEEAKVKVAVAAVKEQEKTVEKE